VPEKYDYILSGEGDEAPGITAGDIYARVNIEKHKVFTRKGADLFIEKKITLLEALTGFNFIIKHVNGKDLTVSSAPGDVISHNSIKTIKGKGMPFYKDSFNYGNLYVKFEVEFPKKGILKEDAINNLKKILPGPKLKPLDQSSNFEYMDDFFEADLNPNPEGGRQKEEEDEEEGHRQQQGVQCQTQ